MAELPFQSLPGFRDFTPRECAIRNYLFETWRGVARRCGYSEYETPILEDTGLYLKKSGGELSAQLFRFEDQGAPTTTQISVGNSTPTGTPTPTATLIPGTKKMTVKSVGAYDGWALESSETSVKGNTLSAKLTLRVGDDAAKKQYRSILYFDTHLLPDNAIVNKVTLKIRKSGLVGADPFKTHGLLLVDMRKGYFGLKTLQMTDFEALASKVSAGKLTALAGQPGWYQLVLTSANYKYVNLKGATQFRLRFTKDDDNDAIADYVSFYAGEAAATLRPALIVEYTMP